MASARPTSPTAEPADDTVALVATALVTSGRVLPGLAVEGDGRSRSWWWPAPAASQRALVAGLVPDGSAEAQRRVASRLADAVDGMVRDQLAADTVALVRRRPGRPTLAEAWMRSLVSADPWLPPSLDPAKVRALADVVDAWVRSATVVGGRVRLCLRVHEPVGADDWFVELLVQDRDEPSLVIPLADALQGESPFGTNVIEETLAALGRLARLAPELAPVLDQALPTGVTVEGDSIVSLLRDRTAWLEDAGIGVLLPSWWTHRSRLGLRARVKRSSPAPGATGGGAALGMDAIVAFDWEVALGEQRLTKRDLAALARAADAKQSLVRLRGQWVEIDPSRVGDLLDSVGTRAQATTRELLRAGLGIDQLGVADSVDVVGVDATAVGWLSSLLDDALHATVEPLPTPVGFEGVLRPYQERGAGWLAFLGRLGLGACLADDMGLGKTAQLIATLLAEPTEQPTLVVCPVSVLGNWQRELLRFAPELRVLVHHGPDRHGDDQQGFAGRAGVHDVVLREQARWPPMPPMR